MERFETYAVARELIRALRPLVAKIARHDRELMRQLRKAGTSVALNVAEGNERRGADKPHLFSVAAGSAREVEAALHAAEDWGYLEPAELQPAYALLDRELAMLWRLTHTRRA